MANIYSSKDSNDVEAYQQEQLQRHATAHSVAIPLDVFEKMYLTPQNSVKGDLRKTFGNPTPLIMIGFLLAGSPLACSLMGWQGSGGGGAATIGVFYFCGGMLQIIGSVMEWILGNTFPFVVFGTYGAFWLSLAATLQPSYNAVGAYTNGASNPAVGEAEFLASFAFFLLFMSIASAMFFVCSLRTNIVFVFIFLLLTTTFALLAAAYWVLAQGMTTLGARIETAAGACAFTFCIAGWYILFAQLLLTLDFPFTLPIGDLSDRIIQAASKKKSADQTK